MDHIVYERTCPVCGKVFTVQKPGMWVYKRAENVFCSWSCMRKYDKEREGTTVGRKIFTKEQLDAVFQAAVSGGNPIKKLEEFGSKNPSGSWYTLKKRWKETDPERYAKLPTKYKPAQVETPESDIVKGPTTPDKLYVTFDTFREIKNVEIPEAPKKVLPMTQLKTRAVEGEFGTYHFKPRNGYLDYESHDYSGIVSMPVTDWKKFLKELHRAADELGVEL